MDKNPIENPHFRLLKIKELRASSLHGQKYLFLSISNNFMAAIHETAYPRLKSNFEDGELIKFYTPTKEELAFAKKHTRTLESKFGLLTHLKVFQRLGYFVLWEAIPKTITKYISTCLGSLFEITPPPNYDESGTRNRHLDHIRKYLGVTSISDATVICFENAALEAVQTKEHITDIINVMVEELVHQRFELPGFTTLDRAAYQIRYKYNEQCFENIYNQLSKKHLAKIDYILESPTDNATSRWASLKEEPDKPTLKTVKSYSE